jgi:hypothetical protein
MRRQEENPVVRSIHLEEEGITVASLKRLQARFDRAVHATANASRTAAEACSAAGVANFAVANSAPDCFVAAYSAVGSATRARDAAAAANAAVVEITPAIRDVIEALEEIVKLLNARATRQAATNDNSSSTHETAHPTHLSEEPTTVTVEPLTIPTEPAAILNTVQAASDNNDDSNDSTIPYRTRLPPPQHQPDIHQDAQASPWPDHHRSA